MGVVVDLVAQVEQDLEVLGREIRDAEEVLEGHGGFPSFAR
jgi:hypothetical protein